MKDRVLLWQSVGFVAVIAFLWLSEAVDLRGLLLFDHPFLTRFQNLAIHMLLILAVWFLVLRTTQRLLARLKQVEGLMHVCGWCSKVRRERDWVGVDRFLLEELDARTTHGICEECCRRQEAALHALGSASAAGTRTRQQPRPAQARLAMVDTTTAKSV